MNDLQIRVNSKLLSILEAKTGSHERYIDPRFYVESTEIAGANPDTGRMGRWVKYRRYDRETYKTTLDSGWIPFDDVPHRLALLCLLMSKDVENFETEYLTLRNDLQNTHKEN